jgi:polyhydroxyalkanoate synthesis regulator phasin
MGQAVPTGLGPRSASAAAGRRGGEVVKPIADDKAYNDAAEAAIARVLGAEREAREAIEQARLQVDPIVERARLDARAVDERTARRIRAVVDAFERELAERLAEIEAAAEQATRPQPFSDEETAALQRAVRALAAELITAPP